MFDPFLRFPGRVAPTYPTVNNHSTRYPRCSATELRTFDRISDVSVATPHSATLGRLHATNGVRSCIIVAKSRMARHSVECVCRGMSSGRSDQCENLYGVDLVFRLLI